MTKTDSSPASSLSADQVADFLRRHPRFLIEHPDLLTALTIPHGTPGNVPSLIERQVARLRSEHARLQKRLADSTGSLSALRKLTGRALDTSLEMLEAGDPNAACDKLRKFIRDHYDADHVNLTLFLDGNPPVSSEFVTVLSRNDKLRILLVELFNRRQPLFDSLQSEHLVMLFGDNAGNAHSTALLPLTGDEWHGLLALGSHQRDRYQRGQAFDLLGYLTNITALILNHRLRKDAC